MIMKLLIYLAVVCNLFCLNHSVSAEELDRIVAVVEDDVILESELRREVTAIVQKIQASNTAMPPDYVIKKQVLEKMIIERLQRHLAEKAEFVSISSPILMPAFSYRKSFV